MSLMDRFSHVIEWIGLAIEVFGVVVIVIGAILATARYLHHARELGGDTAYERLRRGLGRSIMVGLEFLVAGDIIRTVLVDQTFESLGLLAIIVLIRTFLSISLFVEVEGHWPWRSPPEPARPDRLRPPDDRPAASGAPAAAKSRPA